MTIEHTHYWDIETANGPTSFGVCRDCPEVKEFLNSSYTPFFHGKNLGSIQWRLGIVASSDDDWVQED